MREHTTWKWSTCTHTIFWNIPLNHRTRKANIFLHLEWREWAGGCVRERERKREGHVLQEKFSQANQVYRNVSRVTSASLHTRTHTHAVSLSLSHTAVVTVERLIVNSATRVSVSTQNPQTHTYPSRQICIWNFCLVYWEPRKKFPLRADDTIHMTHFSSALTPII